MELILKKGRSVPPLIFILLFSLIMEGISFFYFSKLIEFKSIIPNSDTALYWYLGKLIKEQGIILKNFSTFFFSPIYAYLYYLFSFTPNSISTASIFSGVIFIATSIIIYFLSKNLFNEKVGLLSSILFLTYKPLIFYSLLPIKTMFFLFLLLTFLHLFNKSISNKKLLYPIASGIIGGIALNVEGIFLPLLLTSIVYSLLRKNIIHAFLFLFGITISLLPFSIRNFMVSKTFYPLPSTSGIHLYIGNNPKATGVYTSIKGIRANAFGHYFDAKLIAKRKEKRTLTDSEVNAYWKERAISFIKKNKKDFLKLYIKKLLLTVNNFEYPNNYNIYYVSQKIPTLKFNPFSFSLIFPIGILGIIFYTLKTKVLNILSIIAISYPLILSLFFITSRYRIIWVVLLIPYAAYFLNEFLENLKTRNLKKLCLMTLLIFPLYQTTKINFPMNQKKIINHIYEKRIFFAQRIYQLDNKLNNAKTSKEKKKLLLEEARIFYISQMKEIGDFLRNKAKTLK